MPQTCENWLGLVNSYIYYAHETHEVSQVLPYSVDFRAHWVRQFLVNIVSFQINTL